MNKILIVSIICIMLSIEVHATKLLSLKQIEKQFRQLKSYQKINLVRLFRRAAEDNLSWTVVAIAWEESQFGRFQIGMPNPGSLDCGIMHNNTRSVLTRRDLNTALYNRSGICTMLIVNPEQSYLEFVKEIRYWQKSKGKNNWKKIWGSYNAGYTGGGKNYSIMIARRIAIIKKHMPGLKKLQYYSIGKLRIQRDTTSI